MNNKNGRVMVTLEEPIYSLIKKISKVRGVSRSRLLGEMVADWLERYEDYTFVKECEGRLATFSHKEALTHQKVWRHLK